MIVLVIFLVLSILGGIAVTVIVSNTEISREDYNLVKYSVLYQCRSEARMLREMINNDGIIDYGEFDVFMKACAVINFLNKPHQHNNYNYKEDNPELKI